MVLPELLVGVGEITGVGDLLGADEVVAEDLVGGIVVRLRSREFADAVRHIGPEPFALVEALGTVFVEAHFVVSPLELLNRIETLRIAGRDQCL